MLGARAGRGRQRATRYRRAAHGEREVVAIVRRTGRPHRDLLGAVAYPVGFRERLGVVIVPKG